MIYFINYLVLIFLQLHLITNMVYMFGKECSWRVDFFDWSNVGPLVLVKDEMPDGFEVSSDHDGSVKPPIRKAACRTAFDAIMFFEKECTGLRDSFSNSSGFELLKVSEEMKSLAERCIISLWVEGTFVGQDT